MADFIFKPSLNSEGSFTGSLEFSGLTLTDDVPVSDGTYDIYQKVVSDFSVRQIQAEFGVAQVGEEPVITATAGNVSVTIGAGPYAGIYTTRVTDGATLTVAMIEAAATPIILPVLNATDDVSGSITPALWLYAGDPPTAPAWQQQIDGIDLSGATGLTYAFTREFADQNLTVEETFGGVTIESATTVIPAVVGAYPESIVTNLFIQPSDPDTRFQNDDGTTPATGTDPVGYIADKSGNGRHMTATGSARPVLTGGGITFDGSLNRLGASLGIPPTENQTIFIRVDILNNDRSGQIFSRIDGYSGYIGDYEANTYSITNKAGFPTVSVNGVAVADSGELRTELFTATDPVIEFSNLDLNGFRPWLNLILAGYANSATTAVSIRPNMLVYSLVLMDTALVTPEVRSSMITFMQNDSNLENTNG